MLYKYIKFIPRDLPRDKAHGGLPRGRSVALPLGRARGSYPGRSQKIDFLLAFCLIMFSNSVKTLR